MQLLPIFLGWAISGSILVALHIGLWEHPWRLEPPGSYIVGVGVLLFGCLIWAVTARGPVSTSDAFLSFGLICSSGMLVALAYFIRGRFGKRKKARELARDGIALTQELIDAGGHDATRTPGSPYSRN